MLAFDSPRGVGGQIPVRQSSRLLNRFKKANSIIRRRSLILFLFLSVVALDCGKRPHILGVVASFLAAMTALGWLLMRSILLG